jgi:hypothetical protein
MHVGGITRRCPLDHAKYYSREIVAFVIILLGCVCSLRAAVPGRVGEILPPHHRALGCLLISLYAHHSCRTAAGAQAQASLVRCTTARARHTPTKLNQND